MLIFKRAAAYAARSPAGQLRYASAQSINTTDLSKLIGGLSPIALRDACKCSRCVDQSTKQRDFLLSDIPGNIEASPQVTESGNIEVKWTNDIPGYDEHVSIFTRDDIRNFRKMLKREYRPTSMLWNKSTYERENASVDYNEYMNDESGLAKALWRFRKHGLVFLTGVPSEAESVARIAERIGPLRSTFYGNTWNVKSVPQAKNVAYTSKYLGFHMDLLYMKESPGAQFLHCLENTSVGGESLFADTFKAYAVLQSEQPELAQLLQSIRIRYEYDNDGHYYTNTKPLVQHRGFDDPPFSIIKDPETRKNVKDFFRVYWSPPFVGSIISDPAETRSKVERKLEALKAFAEILERKDMIYETKMDEGTCVIFDNLRVVHARNAFDMNSGKRWLRGCYLDSQDVLSKEFFHKKRILQLEKSSGSSE